MKLISILLIFLTSLTISQTVDTAYSQNKPFELLRVRGEVTTLLLISDFAAFAGFNLYSGKIAELGVHTRINYINVSSFFVLPDGSPLLDFDLLPYCRIAQNYFVSVQFTAGPSFRKYNRDINGDASTLQLKFGGSVMYNISKLFQIHLNLYGTHSGRASANISSIGIGFSMGWEK